MKKLKTEVLVVGSGFGAAPAALRSVEAGLKTIMIEKGPSINPHFDFRQTQDPNGQWVEAEVDGSTPVELENAILTRAREMRIAGVVE